MPNPAKDKRYIIDAELTGLYMVSEDEGWAVGRVEYVENSQSSEVGSIQHYVSGGWVPSNYYGTLDPHDIYMVSRSEGWAVGHDGLILHNQDGIWRPIASPTHMTLNSVSMVSPVEGWAVGSEGYGSAPITSVITHYVGGRWIKAFELNDVTLYKVNMMSPRNGWILGSNAIYHYVGNEWVHESSTPARLNNMSATISGEIWFTADHGMVWRYANGEWTSMDTDTNSLMCIYMLSSVEGWIASSSEVFRYANGTWVLEYELIKGTSDLLIRDIFMLNEHEGWAVGRGSEALHYKNGTWERVKLQFALPPTHPQP